MKPKTALMFGALNIAAVLPIGAQAGVVQIASQAAFSASGTIVQNTNWDAYPTGPTFPGSPFTVGDLTFVQQGSYNLIEGAGGGSGGYNLARALFTNFSLLGTTVQITGTFDLLGFNAGNLLGDGPATFTIITNLNTYAFSDMVYSATNQAPLTFFGFEATGGEHIVSINYIGNTGPGITDVQLGDTVPEPAAWALTLIGLGGMGLTMRSRRRAAAA
jgi:hypothetical protein